MNKLRAWLLRFGGLFRKQRRDRDFSAEMDSHLQMHIEDNLRAGMSPAEARRQALSKLGGIEQTKESVRDGRSLPIMEMLLQDTRYGVRMLRKNPGFTAVVVLTLALGVGANAAVFSVVHAVLLRPLPYPHSDQLVRLARGADFSDVTVPEYQFWKEHTSSFEAIAAYRGMLDRGLDSGGELQWIKALQVTAGFFGTLGTSPALGREFTEEESRAVGPQAIVLTDGLWRSALGGRADAIGRVVRLDHEDYR